MPTKQILTIIKS